MNHLHLHKLHYPRRLNGCVVLNATICLQITKPPGLRTVYLGSLSQMHHNIHESLLSVFPKCDHVESHLLLIVGLIQTLVLHWNKLRTYSYLLLYVKNRSLFVISDKYKQYAQKVSRVIFARAKRPQSMILIPTNTKVPPYLLYIDYPTPVPRMMSYGLCYNHNNL